MLKTYTPDTLSRDIGTACMWLWYASSEYNVPLISFTNPREKTEIPQKFCLEM